MPGKHLPADGSRQVAEEFARVGRMSDETVARLNRMLEDLEEKWDGASQQAFYRQFHSLRPQMARLGVHLALIAQEVNALIQRFESVDRSQETGLNDGHSG